MRLPTWKPEKVVQPALRRAGIVDGYTHVCRRKGCAHREEHPDASLRHCPEHFMKLWPKARIRHIRFHDMRHTYGSVLLMFGANLVSVSASSVTATRRSPSAATATSRPTSCRRR